MSAPVVSIIGLVTIGILAVPAAVLVAALYLGGEADNAAERLATYLDMDHHADSGDEL